MDEVEKEAEFYGCLKKSVTLHRKFARLQEG
jgi:hypothetical protein